MANQGSASVSILFGAEQAGFTPAAATVPTASAPRAPALGDFDSDGTGDLVVPNTGADNLTIMIGTGQSWQSGNLLANGGAEGAGADTTSGTSPMPPGWQVSGPLTYVRYGTVGDFPRMIDAPLWEGGVNFFSGGPANAASSATQSVDVSSSAASIDAGLASIRLSARLGGYRGQADRMAAKASFVDGAGAERGSVVLGPVTANDRNNRTVLLARAQTAAVPAGTRAVLVRLDATGAPGTYNDAYADDVKLELMAPEPPPPPPPPPPAVGDSDPPETTIDKAPKHRSHKRKLKISYSSDEVGSTFECKLDRGSFEPCGATFKDKVKAKRHDFQVRAVDAAGNEDPTPAETKFKVLKKKP